MSDPRIGELFAGYGGLGIAVQQVYGGEIAWYSEFDDAPSRIMARHSPGVPNYGDVTQIDWSTVEPVDILTGGFPCQDVSVAGRRAGMTDGTRSGLWSHMVKAIDTLRPGLVVIENVGGLFSAQADSRVEPCDYRLGDADGGGHAVFLRAFDSVLSTLSELGYDAEWATLRAADVGAPHGRLRVFITAHPQGQPWSLEHRDGRAAEDTRGSEGGGWAQGPAPARGDDAPVRSDPRGGRGRDHHRLMPTPVTTDASGSARHTTTTGRSHPGTSLTDAVRMLPTPRATDGTKGGPNQRGSSGDLMLSSAVAQLLPTPGANLGENGGPQHPDKRRAGGHAVSIEDAVHGITEDQVLSPEFAMGSTDFGPYTTAIHRWEHVLGRPAPDPTEPGKTRPRLAAKFVEWLMGLPDGHVTDVPGLTRNQQLKALGNGVVPQQGAAAIRHLHEVRATR